jgi:hypothetical protein
MQEQLARDFLGRMLAEKVVAGVTGDGDVTLPYDRDQLNDLIERRIDKRRMQEILKDAPGGSLIELLRQRGSIRGV